MKVITCVAPVNIAVIKYWGKRDEELILPLNDSISTTLDTTHMCAKTTVMASPNFIENKLWLNGNEENFAEPRLQNCLKEMKKRIPKSKKGENISEWKIHICSQNNFPTAAGLASSAAGYACLVFALAQLYNVEGDISAIARRGSGSACRSVHGGWVQWCKGERPDGSDSIAVQLQPATHWQEMRVVILVVNDAKKKYSSTSGMQRSVATSTLLPARAKSVVPGKIDEMKMAIKLKNFTKFAKLAMRDSNQFHAICLDTFPPCFYMNQVSLAIIDFVHAYNELKGSTELAYTFDAGPNACLYTLKKNAAELVMFIKEIFPTTSSNEEFVKGIDVKRTPQHSEILLKQFKFPKREPDLLKYIIVTKVGDGPKVLPDEEHHLLDNDGIPRSLLITLD